MSDASIVFIGSLTLRPPGKVIFHAPNRQWTFTDCGLATSHEECCPDHPVWVRDMITCRRDTADTIGRPCGRCRW